MFSKAMDTGKFISHNKNDGKVGNPEMFTAPKSLFLSFPFKSGCSSETLNGHLKTTISPTFKGETMRCSFKG